MQRWPVSTGRWAVVVSLAAAVALAAIVPLGCGSDKTKAQVNELFKQASEHSDNFVKAMNGLQKFQKTWEQLFAGSEETPQTIPTGQALLASAEKILLTARGEIKAMQDDLVKVKELDVSKDMKTYIDMKTGALDEQIKTLDIELQAMQAREKLLSDYQADASIQQLAADEQQVSQLETQAKDHSDQAKKLHQDANDYYTDKKLNR